jgi:chromate transporter
LESITLTKIFFYFLRIGVSVFGGPLAIINYIRNDIVNNKKWITQEEFENYFGYSQIAPGPLAFQMVIYFGYFKKGFFGAFFAGLGLILPSFLLVLLFSIFYKEYHNISYFQSALYSISPVIIAIIIQSGYNLSRSIFKKEILLYVIFIIAVFLTVYLRVNIILVILSGAFISLIYYFFKEKSIKVNKINLITPSFIITLISFYSVIINIKNIVSEKLFEMALIFLKVGSLTYGSGYVIVGVLKQEFVDNLKWIPAKDFLDGIAFGQITPGPVVITSTFIGYMTTGFAGAVIATLCIFLPTFIFVLLLSRYIKKIKDNFYMKSLIKGANAASIGAIVSTAYLLSADAIFDLITLSFFLISIIVLIFTKFKPIYLIILSAVLGIFLKIIFP